MKGKSQDRFEAIRLRKDEGFSLKEICDKLGVSKSSASVWTSGIDLSDTQLDALSKRSKSRSIPGSIKAGQTNKRKGQVQRELWRQEGRVYAKKYDPEHFKSCVLYWAEGSKRRNGVVFVNSDPTMMKTFSQFIFSTPMLASKEKARATIDCYEDIHTIAEIEIFWRNQIGFDIQFGKHTIKPTKNNQEKYAHVKKPYGVCRLMISSTQLVQHIYGALEVYAGVVIDPLK